MKKEESIVEFPRQRIDIAASAIVEAIPAEVKKLVVIGIKEDGTLYHDTNAMNPEVAWMLGLASHRLFCEGIDEDD